MTKHVHSAPQQEEEKMVRMVLCGERKVCEWQSKSSRSMMAKLTEKTAVRTEMDEAGTSRSFQAVSVWVNHYTSRESRHGLSLEASFPLD